MTGELNTREGWYVGRREGSSEWKGGPYSWEEIATFVRDGRVSAEDLVWHASLPDWIPARDVPGLVPPQAAAAAGVAAGAPTTHSATSTVPAQASTPRSAPSASRSAGRGWLVATAVVSAVLIVVALGGVGFWAYSNGMFGGGASTGSGPNLGRAETKLPDSSKLIQTSAYGQVPANQIGVTLRGGGTRKDAEKLAKQLGGSVVGEVEFINLYQIEFGGSSESDLNKAIATAKADPTVELAFANAQIGLDAEIKGVRVDPYEDPIYGDGAGDGYKAIGVSKAWQYIKGSGIELNDVHVGVVDTGLYKPGEGAENEFGGKVRVDFLDAAADELSAPTLEGNGKRNTAGSHGTAVSTIIGGDPDNGGPAGVAGPLGKKLRMTMVNSFGGSYGGFTTTTPDPQDTSKVVYGQTSYLIGSIVALNKQIESGSTIINCSWNNSAPDPIAAKAYFRYFKKMAAEHPDIMFVCSAGNTGAPVEGGDSYPGGQVLSNMITVGAVNNDGTLASYSSRESAPWMNYQFEVTLAAPGTQAVVGIADRGGPERMDGTSFAAPEVTAAAAMIRSINPKLTAGEIKDILASTARKGTLVGDPSDPKAHSNMAPPETGGRVLAVDAAVLKAINDVRVAKGLKPMDAAMLEKLGVIDAIATTGKAGEYAVRGIVEATGEQGTKVSIDVTGEDNGIGGDITQSLAGPGEAKWGVTLPKDQGTIKVTRLDNGAASLITIDPFDINGRWTGTFTLTDITVSDAEAANKEGCSVDIADALKGKPLPMTMDISADSGGNGSAQMLVDVSSLNTGDSKITSEPQNFGLTYSGNTITFDPSQSKGLNTMTAAVSRDEDNLAMKGVINGSGSGWSMKVVFDLTKPVR